MKVLFTTLAAVLAVCATPALAADMAVKMPLKAPPPVVSGWTGCYVGGNVGYAWQHTQTTDNDPFNAGNTPDVGSDTGTGAVGGGQIGCDYQFSGNWVIGLQGMFDAAGVNGSHIDPFAYSGSTTEYHAAKARWFATLTARLGYTVTPSTLLYVKGGAAWVRDTFTSADPASPFFFVPFSGQSTVTRSGWTVGGGAEYKFSANWSAFAEYNYIGLGSKTSGYTYNCGAACGFPDPYVLTDKVNFQSVLVGLNYRFSAFAAR